MSTVFLARGNYTLGRRTTDGEGNVIEEYPARFETNPKGGCIAVGFIDEETGELKPADHLFGDWQAAEYLEMVVKMLGPTRPINIPDIKAMVRQARGTTDEDFICDQCRELPGFHNCRDCVVKEWKEDDG